MLKNYWIVTWRNLARNKMYSFINVLGLALGICVCLAIYLITRYEFSFDTFHPDCNRIFCVDAGMHGTHWNCVPGPMPADMSREISGFETVALIGNIEKDWKTIFPGAPFGYSFLDDSIAKLYADDLRTALLTKVAMGITVFISCLGLLGLSIFSTNRRTREIGIRKVLGANVSGIVVMLCKDIVLLIVLALLIATPLAWYYMHGWLQGFAYRTALNGWMFVAAGAAAIGIALLTVGFQAMNAAMANPVKSLRTE
jgi:hypothetical protein